MRYFSWSNVGSGKCTLNHKYDMVTVQYLPWETGKHTIKVNRWLPGNWLYEESISHRITVSHVKVILAEEHLFDD